MIIHFIRKKTIQILTPPSKSFIKFGQNTAVLLGVYCRCFFKSIRGYDMEVSTTNKKIN